jgi:hypothetical protein
VETNQGSSIPVEDAWKLWTIVRRCVRKGTSYDSTDISKDNRIKFGGYDLDRITENGNVKIGCHRITYQEMDRIANDVEFVIAHKKETV